MAQRKFITGNYEIVVHVHIHNNTHIGFYKPDDWWLWLPREWRTGTEAKSTPLANAPERETEKRFTTQFIISHVLPSISFTSLVLSRACAFIHLWFCYCTSKPSTQPYQPPQKPQKCWTTRTKPWDPKHTTVLQTVWWITFTIWQALIYEMHKK